MDIHPIKTEVDYQAALKEIQSLFDASLNTPEADKLEVLATHVEPFEEQHFNIPAPDPIEAVKYFMESRA